MRITKSQLKQIIKEEIERAFKTGVPDEEALEHGLDLEKYPLTPEELESDRIAQELEDAWVAGGNPKKRLVFVEDDILDMAMAVRDGDMTMEDALAQVNNLVSEGKADKRQKKSTKEWGKKKRKEEGGKYRADSKRYLRKKEKEVRGGEELDEELMDEKCKGSGCATPKEVEKYAKAIKRDADNKNEVNPYAVAWKAAREPGSEGGTTVVGRKKGYKK